MASYQFLHPLCRFLGALEIDAGTLCRTHTAAPGPAGASIAHANVHGATSAKPPRTYAEHRGAVKDPMSYVDTPVILNSKQSAQCAELVEALAGAPRTVPDRWQRGTALTEALVVGLEIGTPIATGWDQRGFYPNNPTGQHSGIFAGPFRDKSGKVLGFIIVEQYSRLTAIESRIVYFDPVAAGKKNTYFYRGRDYATIKW